MVAKRPRRWLSKYSISFSVKILISFSFPRQYAGQCDPAHDLSHSAPVPALPPPRERLCQVEVAAFQTRLTLKSLGAVLSRSLAEPVDPGLCWPCVLRIWPPYPLLEDGLSRRACRPV